MIAFPHRLYLTFDVEDFINDQSMGALAHILRLLNKHRQDAMFFITGHMAEKLLHFPRIIQLLEGHEVGYHSTSHSIHPTIFEYTDVSSYQEAYQTSLSREVAHINPLSGRAEGRGGLELLRDVFSHKEIRSFRAPGFSWSPPHLEALMHLGIKYDFSTNISPAPVSYRGITFFPHPSFIDSVPISGLLRSVKEREVTILDFHPSFFVNEDWWDSIFFSETSLPKVSGVAPRAAIQIRSMFRRFDMILKTVSVLRQLKLAESLDEGFVPTMELDLARVDIAKIYRAIAAWPMNRFNYDPKFIHSHLMEFFGQLDCS